MVELGAKAVAAIDAHRPVVPAVAERLDRDRLLAVLGRDHEPGGDVEQDAGAARERERRHKEITRYLRTRDR